VDHRCSAARASETNDNDREIKTMNAKATTPEATAMPAEQTARRKKEARLFRKELEKVRKKNARRSSEGK
jgi:hypothetical protein